jgi:cell division protein FtsQ
MAKRARLLLFSSREARWAAAGAAVLLAAGLGSLGWRAWQIPWQERIDAALASAGGRIAAVTGFTVRDVLVVGRNATPKAMLLDAVDVSFGAPTLGVDLPAVRERLLALPWVSTASVERILPDTLIVRISEREPIALWQHNKQFTLIDREGRALADDSAGAHPELLIVVGEGAPRRAAALVGMLAAAPELRRRVEAAVLVGERRWNLHLDNGISVRLPEEAPGEAWQRLAGYEQAHGLLAKNIRIIDMRFPDRLILTPREPEDAAPADGAGDAPGASGGGNGSGKGSGKPAGATGNKPPARRHA